MAKKVAKKAAKKTTTKTGKQSQMDKLRQAMYKHGGQVMRSDPGRGREGYMVRFFGKDGHALVTIELVPKEDGTWRLKCEPLDSLRADIEKAGFKLAERKKPVRKEPTPQPDDSDEGIIRLHR